MRAPLALPLLLRLLSPARAGAADLATLRPQVGGGGRDDPPVATSSTTRGRTRRRASWAPAPAPGPPHRGRDGAAPGHRPHARRRLAALDGRGARGGGAAGPRGAARGVDGACCAPSCCGSGWIPTAELELPGFAPPMVPLAVLPQLDSSSRVRAGDEPLLARRWSCGGGDADAAAAHGRPRLPTAAGGGGHAPAGARRRGPAPATCGWCGSARSASGPGLATDAAQVVGQQLRRPLAEGLPFALIDLAAPAAVIEQNATVTDAAGSGRAAAHRAGRGAGAGGARRHGAGDEPRLPQRGGGAGDRPGPRPRRSPSATSSRSARPRPEEHPMRLACSCFPSRCSAGLRLGRAAGAGRAAAEMAPIADPTRRPGLAARLHADAGAAGRAPPGGQQPLAAGQPHLPARPARGGGGGPHHRAGRRSRTRRSSPEHHRAVARQLGEHGDPAPARAGFVLRALPAERHRPVAAGARRTRPTAPRATARSSATRR